MDKAATAAEMAKIIDRLMALVFQVPEDERVSFFCMSTKNKGRQYTLTLKEFLPLKEEIKSRLKTDITLKN